MSLKKSIENLKYDARMVDINLKASLLTSTEWQKHLEKLPDLQANSAPVEFEAEDQDSDSHE
jgi:hypothetical protein